MEELVLRLYEDALITSEQGAALLQMERLRFEQFLAKHEIPIHGKVEIEQEMRNRRGVTGDVPVYHDLDHLAGTWSKEEMDEF